MEKINRKRSDQADVLRRKLTLRLFLEWLAYSAIFLVLAILANTFLVPRIADFLANSTSEWHYWQLSDYSLNDCLSELDGHLFAIDDASTKNAMSKTSNASADANESDSGIEADDGTEDVASDNDSSTSKSDLLEAFEWDTKYLIEKGLTEVEALEKLSIEVSSKFEVDPYTALLVSIDNQNPEWTNLNTLREATVHRIIEKSGLPLDNWQFLSNSDVMEGRNLSTYYTLRSMKEPLAIGIYLLGCVIIVFVGYGRSLKYFDELSRAVRSVITNKEEPIKLPPQLSITQGELNDIRLTSLSDERAAQAAEIRKEELVAYLAHDIKTPLTAIMGYLLLLNEAPDMPIEMRERYTRIAAEKAERLEGLIDEFFEITRYNLQAIPIERQNINLNILCQQVAEEFFPNAEARNLAIRINVPEYAKVFVDPEKFARALGNIVRNAIAYADEGTEICIKAEHMENADADENGEDSAFIWKISISDKGREISPSHLTNIFDRFYREDGARSSESGRAGLGLAIAKEIVIAHGGKIEAVSNEGLTTFIISIPA